jgi:hypothetical protein
MARVISYGEMAHPMWENSIKMIFMVEAFTTG